MLSAHFAKSLLPAAQRLVRAAAAPAAARGFHTNLVCTGCSATADGGKEARFTCPNAAGSPEINHILQPAPLTAEEAAELAQPLVDEPTGRVDGSEHNPFVRFRPFLYAYRVARARGMSDDAYVELVDRCSSAVAAVDAGRKVAATPVTCDADRAVFLKHEWVGVAMSHKSRHLFNIMLYLMVLRETAPPAEAELLAQRRLAVASCGNAGIAAATISRALDWPIDVCIPDTAAPAVVAKLRDDLGASVLFCPREQATLATEDGRQLDLTKSADPCVSAFQSLVSDHAAVPFSVQGSECGLAAEGAKTIAWELVHQLASDEGASLGWRADRPARMFVQVGGGALASGVSQGFHEALGSPESGGGALRAFFPAERFGPTPPQLHCVQAEGNQPLVRAMQRLRRDGVVDVFAEAAPRADEYMTAWEDPASVAYGILDDVTYDWAACAQAMISTDGGAETVTDDAIVAAHKDLHGADAPACHTGAVALAGCLQAKDTLPGDFNDVVLVTGQSRE